MPICAVFGCNNHTRYMKRDGLHFFSFPSASSLQKAWVHFCRRNDKINLRTARICSNHFVDEDYKNLMQHKLIKTKLCLKPGAIPSKNPPHLKSDLQIEDCHKTNARTEQALKRRKNYSNLDSTLIAVDPSVIDTECTTGNTIISDNEITHYNDPCFQNVAQFKEENERLKQENEILYRENLTLQKALKNKEKDLQDYKRILNSFFTPGQIAHLLNPDKVSQWSS